jgi:chromosome segregation ATPase
LTVARTKTAVPTSGSTEWLENEVRDTKARLHKLESELAQALKIAWSLDADVQKVVQGVAVSGSVEATLQSFREEVRELSGQLGKVQERQGQLANRIEHVGKARKAETGRERYDVSMIAKQVESISRTIDQFDGRMKAFEEVARHLEEEIAGSRLTAQASERLMEDIQTKSARSHEATMRLDQEFARFSGEFQRLEAASETLADRLSLALDQLHKVMERQEQLEATAGTQEEAKEALQSAAYEREQISHRMAGLEHIATEITERTDEFIKGLARLDQRSKNQASELMAMAARLEDLTEQTKMALKKVYKTFLRQRRRASEALNQEIKELTQGELHATD